MVADSDRPSETEARASCERVIASRVFAGSPMLTRFLRFVVDEKLAGRGDALKEYVVGVNALGRSTHFDPAADSAVRVAARQLRYKLSEYFADEGRDDAVVLELPKGAYVPAFRFRESQAATTVATPPDVVSIDGAPLVSSDPRVSSAQRWIVVLLVLAVFPAIALLWNVRSRSANAPSSATAVMPSIVVLPFLNLSGSPADEYISDGMTEEITASLARSDKLRVVARTSAFHFKGRAQDVRTIARELSADVVLEGSLRKAGDQYRITTQLINAADGVHLWSHSYDASQHDLFRMYDDIARAVAGEINARVGGTIRLAAPKYATHDAEAYALVLEGRFNWNKRTPDALKRSVQLYTQAIARDSLNAQAFAGLADSYATMAVNSVTPPGESPPKAIAAAQRALALDSTRGEPHAAIALMRAFQDWDWDGADAEFTRAIALSPNYATAHSWYAITLLARGRFDDALAQLSRARTLDPLSTAIAYNIAEANYYARRGEEAERRTQRVFELDSNSLVTYSLLGRIYASAGRVRDARAAFVKANDSLAIAERVDTTHGYAMLRMKMKQMTTAERNTSPYWMGVLHSTMGSNDSAFVWFNRAFELRHLNLVSLKTEPSIDRVRSDSRYVELLRKMHLDPSR